MRKLFTCILLFSVTYLANAQVQWVRDFKLAQAMALSNDKFIVMDFWAVWCGPCRKMDSDMWNTEKMNAISDKFIFLKIDVDQNQTLARGYQATTIPKVIIIDPSGQPVWDKIGYGGASPYLAAFERFSIEQPPMKDFTNLIEEKNLPSSQFNVAMWYQSQAVRSESSFSSNFLTLSDNYFKQVIKSDNETLAEEAEFNLILNYAYKGNTKKALKKVAKMDEDEMKNFILAYCYKCEGQTELMKKFSEKVQSEELLARLEE